MRLIVELEIEDENIPIWAYSTGIIGYCNRDLKDCKRYVKHFLENVSGIKIIKIKRKLK